ncbi:MAG: glycine hydroxymethyltransferase, partial [Spirochaetaceae bacterium]|nr:glycine hydroxymethyltransferase [Spirochaetaceae bacterium]
SLVLKGTKPAPEAKTPSRLSKMKYEIAPEVKVRALERVRNLLSRFPVYPELDLDALKAAFTG